jgi:hypothetical protein
MAAGSVWRSKETDTGGYNLISCGVSDLGVEYSSIPVCDKASLD